MLVRNYKCDNDYCAKMFKYSLMRVVLRKKITCPYCEQEYYPVLEGNALSSLPSLLSVILSIIFTLPLNMSPLKLVILIIEIFLFNLLITYIFYELNLFKVTLTKKRY